MENKPSPTTTVAATTSQRRHTQYNVNYYYARQLMPSSLTSSSYDYWWPYPPEGATATTSTTFPLYMSTDTAFTSTSTPALAFPFDSASMVSSSFIGSPSDSLSVTSMSSSATSSSPSESIISISALPPSNSTVPASSHHKLSMVPQSTLVYIVPACGVVGLLIGGITAWCVYGCLTRNGHSRRRGRKSYGTLEVGPEYTQPSPRRGEKPDDGEEGEWVGDEKHAEESDDGEDTAQGDASDGKRETGTETEGFLHPGSAQKRPAASSIRTKSTASTTTTTYTTARTKSTRSSRGTSPTPSGRTSLFFDRPDSTDPLPWESLRHTSIKRGILERLRDDGRQPQDGTGTDRVARRPWQAHGRHESDLLIADAQADLSRAASSVTASSAALSRASTARSGPGFRILQESPAGTPQRERAADVFGWPSVEEDKYTRVPARVARSRSQSPEKASRANSPEKFERGASPDKLTRAMNPSGRRGGGMRPTDGNDFARRRGRKIDIDSSGTSSAPSLTNFRNVLPQSPPRISSPVLDGALCFTPIPSPSLERTPEMNSFASFGAPSAEEVVAMARMKHGAGERAVRGTECPVRD
ncbi:hypothetical protein C8F04DRAFT_1234631 [Mycena alexandri]|uniref:Uncharacterized protein n=1 Tax=Mycena alexandri TaxID=1745969 RepID=A0AAD6X2V7_9AGAR|nr:hypothetical protein C8F04DRAFT_1234631 [Mycena alexandri]